VVRVAAAERTDYASSVVQVLGTDNDGAARALADVLKVPETAISTEPVATEPSPTADIRIVVGRDFRVPTS
jgi:hypothetical protein